MKKSTNKTNATKIVSAPIPKAVSQPVVAPKPVIAPATISAPAAKSAIVTSAAPITIEAKIDVGFGNNLFLRGEGEGLSWDRGIPLENVDSRTWRLLVPAKKQVQFKLLINDAVWAQGEDCVAAPGKKIEVTPTF